ncbi:MAG: hypothetical protein KDK45_12275, partial [Leptospiraceae bacterium]|nr:hypothetical protein [Leptospiraceae bacterium]
MKKTATGKSFSHNPSYPFLNVYKEKEAVVMGLVPTGKYHQVLYNHIKKSSTNQNASSGNLVSLKEMQLDKNKLKRNEVLEILNQLLTVRLISHVVAFEYDPYQRKIRCKSHFITHPPSEKPDSLISVFEEMIDASVSAFETWIELRDSIKIEGFKKILEKQLHGGEDYSEQIGSLIDIDKEIRTKNYELQASDEMMDYVAQEVRSRLIKRKIAIPLSPKYILMLKESETLEHFEAASNILETRILPSLKTDPGFKQKVDKIVLEELTYNVEKFSVKTASFTAKKAKEARVYRGGNSEIDYPGSLSIETIINLETSAEKLYQTTWKEECTKRINEFKRPLQAPSSRSDSLITFIKQEDIANFPKEVWAALVNDNELYYSKWQSPTSTVHVFISKNPKVFKLLINEMQRLPIDQLWKSLALKNLIEENEHELKPLFQDRIFLLNYGRLLKQVYIQFMPWYYKFLF